MNDRLYDIVIIGGGPAGAAASVYAARKKLKTLLLAESFGGQSSVSGAIENWIGEEKMTGLELAEKLEKHVRAQEGIEVKVPEGVIAVTEAPSCTFEVVTDRSTYRSRTLIIASGARHRRLNVPGEERLAGKGVAFCSTCDAPFYQDLDVAVVGSGNSALEAAIDLSTYAKRIYLLIRSEKPKADPMTQERIAQRTQVVTIANAEIQEIIGEQTVTGLRYKDKNNAEIVHLGLSGVFVEIGSVANSAFVRDLVKTNESGEIVVNHQTARTSKQGIFAAGDVTDDPFKQNNIAAGDGVRAALCAYHYLLNIREHSPCADTEDGSMGREETPGAGRKDYQEKMEAQLKEWAEKLDILRAKAVKAKAEAQKKYSDQIEELQKKQAALSHKLNELRRSGDEAWEELKPGLDRAWSELKDSLNRAISKFKEKG